MAASVPIPIGAGQLTIGIGEFKGINVRETSGAGTASVRLFDNTAGSGTLLGTYFLAANGFWDTDFNDNRQVTKGLVVVITGTVEGSIFV